MMFSRGAPPGGGGGRGASPGQATAAAAAAAAAGGGGGGGAVAVDTVIWVDNPFPVEVGTGEGEGGAPAADCYWPHPELGGRPTHVPAVVEEAGAGAEMVTARTLWEVPAAGGAVTVQVEGDVAANMLLNEGDLREFVHGAHGSAGGADGGDASDGADGSASSLAMGTIVNNLAALQHQSPPAAVNAIRRRMVGESKYYTFAGVMLLAINPFAPVYGTLGDGSAASAASGAADRTVSVYSEEYMRRYGAYHAMAAKVAEESLAAAAAAAGAGGREGAETPVPAFMEPPPLSQQDPHIFVLTDKAFQALVREAFSQSIVLQGASGTGKTENAKLALLYLLNVEAIRQERAGPCIASAYENSDWFYPIGSAQNPFTLRRASSFLDNMLTHATTLLESWGNACTACNNNSSRFVRALQVFYDIDGSMVGAQLRPTLLEKSRVMRFVDSERTFHIFYQFFLARSQDREQVEALHLCAVLEDYNYLNQSSATIMDGIDDVAEFNSFVQALTALGFSGDDEHVLERILSAILLLGNLEFIGSEQASISAGCRPLIGHVEQLIGVPADSLSSGMLHKHLEAGGRSTEMPLKVEEAVALRNSMSKGLYSLAFDWIVNHINDTILQNTLQDMKRATANSPNAAEEGENAVPLSISIVDGFGFEVHETNSLEQLCINYADEKLLQFLVQTSFKLETELYEAEQITVSSSFNIPDNKPILDLIEKKPMGVLGLLDEACLFPRSSDSSFLQKVQSTHRRTHCFARPPRNIATHAFAIEHSSGTVAYDVTGFLERNRYRLSPAMHQALVKSNVPQIQQMAEMGEQQASQGANSRSKKRASFIGGQFMGSKFREEMTKLITMLQQTSPHFVQCLNPNDAYIHGYFDHEVVTQQLNNLLVTDALTLRSQGFTYRCTYEDFYENFIMIIPTDTDPKLVLIPPRGADYRELCRKLLPHLWELSMINQPISKCVQYGRTMIFVKSRIGIKLEEQKNEKLQDMDRAATLLQSAYRMSAVRKTFLTVIDGIRRFQAKLKGGKQRKHFLEQRKATLVIQRQAHTYVTRKWFVNARISARVLQTFMFKYVGRMKWRRMRRGVRAMHCLARSFVVRHHVNHMVRASRHLQRHARDFLERNRTYWMRVHLAVKLQAWHRGAAARSQHDDVLHWLELKRQERERERSVRKVQAAWKGLLVRRRFQQLQKGANVLQQWSRSHAQRRDFLEMKYAALWIQAAFRGMRARNQARSLRVLDMVSDEQWRVKTVRERELLQLARVNAQEISSEMRALKTETAAHTRLMPQKLCIMDVDTIVDSSEAYPHGWCVVAAELDAALQKRHKHIVDIAVGNTHCLALDDSGDLHSWGWNDNGQLGHGSRTNESRPRRVESIIFQVRSSLNAAVDPNRSSVKVRQVATGQDHVLALTEDGRICSWGANRRGQLGHSNFKGTTLPRQVEDLRRRITAIACGSHHSVALADPGTVFTWGAGAMLGNGSYEGKGDRSVPEVVRMLAKTKIRQIASGWRHVCVVSYHCDVLAWGSNAQGQLGVGDTNDRLAPTRVLLEDALADLNGGTAPSLSGNRHGRLGTVGEAPSAAAATGGSMSGSTSAGGAGGAGGAGATPSAAATGGVEEGASTSAASESKTGADVRGGPGAIRQGGAGGRGAGSSAPSTRSGTGKTSTNARQHRISEVCCGGRHTAAITTGGRVFTWGWNRYGQIGSGNTQDMHTPYLVQDVIDRRITSVGLGWRHTVACTPDADEMYGWGFISSMNGDDAAARDGSLETTARSHTRPRPIVLPNKEHRAANSIRVAWSQSLSATYVSYQMRLSQSEEEKRAEEEEAQAKAKAKVRQALRSTKRDPRTSATATRTGLSTVGARAVAQANSPRAGGVDMSEQSLRKMSPAQLRNVLRQLESGDMKVVVGANAPKDVSMPVHVAGSGGSPTLRRSNSTGGRNASAFGSSLGPGSGSPVAPAAAAATATGAGTSADGAGQPGREVRAVRSPSKKLAQMHEDLTQGEREQHFLQRQESLDVPLREREEAWTSHTYSARTASFSKGRELEERANRNAAYLTRVRSELSSAGRKGTTPRSAGGGAGGGHGEAIGSSGAEESKTILGAPHRGASNDFQQHSDVQGEAVFDDEREMAGAGDAGGGGGGANELAVGVAAGMGEMPFSPLEQTQYRERPGDSMLGLFSPAQLVAASNKDTSVSRIHSMYGHSDSQSPSASSTPREVAPPSQQSQQTVNRIVAAQEKARARRGGGGGGGGAGGAGGLAEVFDRGEDDGGFGDGRGVGGRRGPRPAGLASFANRRRRSTTATATLRRSRSGNNLAAGGSPSAVGGGGGRHGGDGDGGRDGGSQSGLDDEVERLRTQIERATKQQFQGDERHGSGHRHSRPSSGATSSSMADTEDSAESDVPPPPGGVYGSLHTDRDIGAAGRSAVGGDSGAGDSGAFSTQGLGDLSVMIERIKRQGAEDVAKLWEMPTPSGTLS